MTPTQKPRMCIALEVGIANPCAWFRYVFVDGVQTSLRRNKLGWRKPKPSQKHGIRLNVLGYAEINTGISEVEVSLDVFQAYS